MSKTFLRAIILLLVLTMTLFLLTGCSEKKDETNMTNDESSAVNNTDEDIVENTSEENVVKTTSDEIGTAGSNMPLKDNYEEAEYQIKVAVQNLFKETYGDKVVDARIYVEKIYTSEDEAEVEALKEMNLGPNEVAFKIRYDLKPAKDANGLELSIPNGEYEDGDEWVKNNTRIGILRPDDSGNSEYKITNYGTGW